MWKTENKEPFEKRSCNLSGRGRTNKKYHTEKARTHYTFERSPPGGAVTVSLKVVKVLTATRGTRETNQDFLAQTGTNILRA